MEKRGLKDWLDSFLEYTERVESPKSLRLWTGISTIASVLERKCAIAYGEETWYPNMYIVLIAPAGQVRKTTIMTRGRELLDQTEGIRIAPNVTTIQKLIRILRTSMTNELDAITHEVTMQSSMTIFNGELTTFLGYHNKELITMLADWYDCGSKWEYETKHDTGGGNVDHIYGVWVNMLGATTPQLLQASIPPEFISGGLASRTVFVYEEGGLLIRGNEPRNEKLRNALVEDLKKIRRLRGMFKVTEEFDEEWDKFRIKNHEHPPFRGNPMFEAYVSRRAVQVAKLSMIVHASHSDTKLIDGKDIRRAIEILEKAEKKMHHVFGGVGDSVNSMLIYRVQRIIAKHEQITYKELQRLLVWDCDQWHLDKILETLVASNFIRRPWEPKVPATIYFRKKEWPSFAINNN